MVVRKEPLLQIHGCGGLCHLLSIHYTNFASHTNSRSIQRSPLNSPIEHRGVLEGSYDKQPNRSQKRATMRQCYRIKTWRVLNGEL